MTTTAGRDHEQGDGLIEVTVKVPAARLADFYQVLGQWLAGSLVSDDEPPSRVDLRPWTDSHSDCKLAWQVLNRLTEPARRLFQVLASHPEVRYGADELAELAGIANGRYGIAGVLAWPSRFFAARNRPLPVEMEPRDGGSIYWMKADVARLILEALRNEPPSPPRG